MPHDFDIVIVGAGAAGLATAIFAGRAAPAVRIAVLDGAQRPGAKILVSGGGRCNVTNTRVHETDFWGGRPPIVRRVLRAFPAEDAAAFFRAAGVPLHEEVDGKLFPDSHRARDVLEALLSELHATGAQLMPNTRVHGIARAGAGFAVETSAGRLMTRVAVLATGGRSLPKSGSDGAGYGIAQALGHSIVPTTPALAPLLVAAEGDRAMHALLTGVSLEAAVSLWIEDRLTVRLSGPLLWTHFGVSGPVVLNLSRHWARAELAGQRGRVTVNLLPQQTFGSADAWLRDAARARPRGLVRSILSPALPDAVARAVMEIGGLHPEATLADFSRDDRRRLVHALTAWPLAVTGTRGYNYAEVTAGGVALNEIDPARMASRACEGLYLVGEILDVDGRLGGFNFQWAWSSAFVAGRAIARAAAIPPPD